VPEALLDPIEQSVNTLLLEAPDSSPPSLRLSRAASLDKALNRLQDERMQKAALQFALLLLLAVWLTGPVFALVDPLDSYPDTGDTITLLLAIVGSCIGILFCLVLMVYRLLKSASTVIISLLPRLSGETSPVLTPHRPPFGPLLALRI
jgi:hypothetical protein